jgi:hypothetical protein
VLAFDPLNEEATLSLAEATALAGSKIEALALLDRYVAELGVERPARLELPPALLRRRIAERLPEAPASRPLETVFVGRGDSMAFLNRALQRAKRGASESCYVWGCAGIGKTRLLDEFRGAAILDGVRVERVACQPSDSHRPLSVFAALVPRLIALPGALGCAPETLELLRRLSAHDTTASGLSPETAEADFLAANIRRSIYDLVDAVSSEGPLLIIVEDVHWSDSRSRRLISELACWVANRPVALVFSSRAQPAEFEAVLSVHHLGPLSPADTSALVRSLAPAGGLVDSAAAERCVRISEGNPLYARTLMDFWQQQGDTNAVPPSMTVLLANRMHGLGDESLLALRAIALLGRDATIERLARVLQLRSYQLVRALDELASEGMISDEGDRIACAHELIACAAAEGLTGIARRSLHRLIAEQLEAEQSASTDAGILWDCANHWKQAGEPERAIRFALDCSKHLLELGLPHEAAELLTSARSGCDDTATKQELLGTLAVAYQQSARWADLVEVLGEKFRRATRAENADVDGIDEELMFLEGSLRAEIGDLRDLARRASELGATAAPNQALRAASLALTIHAECCDEALATVTYEKTCEVRQASDVDPLLVTELDVVYHTSFGDVLCGAKAAEKLIELARVTASPQMLARALRFATASFRMAGRLDDAEAVLLESLSVGNRHKLATVVAKATTKMAVLKLIGNDFDAALEWSRRGLALAGAGTARIHSLEQTVTRVQAHLGLRDIPSAIRVYESETDYSITPELPRVVAEFAALRLRMKIEAESATVGRADVESLYAHYVQMRDKGIQDFVVATLMRALAACGDGVRARHLCTEYVRIFRRERTPLSIDLSDIYAQLGVATPPPASFGRQDRIPF